MGQIVKFVELVHDCMNLTICHVANYILSKPQRNEMNRQYCDGLLLDMNALTAQRFISVQSNEPR